MNEPVTTDRSAGRQMLRRIRESGCYRPQLAPAADRRGRSVSPTQSDPGRSDELTVSPERLKCRRRCWWWCNTRLNGAIQCSYTAGSCMSRVGSVSVVQSEHESRGLFGCEILFHDACAVREFGMRDEVRHSAAPRV